jgi:hypothetical protein
MIVIADAHDHSRHLVKRKSKTKTTVSWRLDLLKDKQIAYHPSKQRMLSRRCDMDEYQNIEAPGARMLRRHNAHPRAQSIGCKISKGRGTAAWWTQEL